MDAVREGVLVADGVDVCVGVSVALGVHINPTRVGRDRLSPSHVPARPEIFWPQQYALPLAAIRHDIDVPALT